MRGHFQMFLVLLPALAAAADSTIVVNAEVRLRGEVDGRDFSARTPMVSFSLLGSKRSGASGHIPFVPRVRRARALDRSDGPSVSAREALER